MIIISNKPSFYHEFLKILKGINLFLKIIAKQGDIKFHKTIKIFKNGSKRGGINLHFIIKLILVGVRNFEVILI